MGENTTRITLCYSMPRMISPAIQCSFCAYFWEMYTGEFGWTKSEYGVISWFYSGTQMISFIALGCLFKWVIDKSGKPVETKLNETKGVEICGTAVHWLTYFFLIFLPIKWHNIKTPYVDSMLGKTAGFWRILYYGPIRSARKTECIDEAFLWLIRPIWFLFFIPMKVCFLCIVNFGTIGWVLSWPFRMIGKCCCLPFKLCRKPQPKVVDEILPVLETLRDPTCSACCNTTCCNNFAMRMRHFGRWFGTKTCFLCLITLIHGVGMSMHELSNKALESYIYLDAGASNAININLSFFFASNIVIYFIFSFVKLHVHSKAAFAETFYLLSIIFLVLCIPILPGFFFGATKDDATSSQGIKGPVECLCLKWASATVFHSTVVFLIFSGGPLTFYLALFILGGHKMLMSFGVLVLFGALNGTSWIFIIATKIAGTYFFNFKAFTDFTTQMAVTGACIVGQLLTFFLLYKHDWSWNKSNWVNYILLILTGAVNAIFVTYANILVGGVTKDARARDWAWIFFGGFYSGTNVVVSTAMPIMFNSFGKNEMKRCCCIRFKHCFPMVYNTITFVFILANFIAFGVYCFVHFVDQLIAAIYKFVDAAKLFKAKAEAFNTAAEAINVTPTGGNANVQQAIDAFKNAAKIFGNTADPQGANDESAAKHFKDIGNEFQTFANQIWKPQYLRKLLSLRIVREFKDAASTFQQKANDFKTQAGNGPNKNDGFLHKVKEFHDAGDGELVQKFQAAALAFGEANNGVGAKFNAAATAFTTNTFKGAADNIKSNSLNNLQNKAQTFQQKANDFKTQAGPDNNGFLEKANAVNDFTSVNNINDIKASFLAAAEKFVDAASAFNDAAQAFEDIL